jgi:hypothetical protein
VLFLNYSAMYFTLSNRRYIPYSKSFYIILYNSCKCYNLFKIIGLLDSTLSVSDSTLSNWMKADFTDTEISPHLSDYCLMCFQFTTSLNSLQIQINFQKVCSFNVVSIQLPYQYHNDSIPVPDLHHRDTVSVPNRYHTDTVWVLDRYRTNNVLILYRYRTDTVWVPD